jgi:protein ImuB
MAKRYVSLWFRHLKTDWLTLRQPQLANKALVLCTPSHGKMLITATNRLVESQGINIGMAVADARAIYPLIEVKDDNPAIAEKLLNRLAEWCIRFSPFVSIDPPNGLIIDATGCSHLWGGDEAYLEEIIKRIKEKGYDVRGAMADTIGLSIALARFGKDKLVIAPGNNMEAILPLPTASLRVDPEIIVRLHKLGLWQISDFIKMPRSSLRRRFGQELIKKLNQAIGFEDEFIQPVQPVEPYQERLHCLELIVTGIGIEIAKIIGNIMWKTSERR